MSRSLPFDYVETIPWFTYDTIIMPMLRYIVNFCVFLSSSRMYNTKMATKLERSRDPDSACCMTSDSPKLPSKYRLAQESSVNQGMWTLWIKHFSPGLRLVKDRNKIPQVVNKASVTNTTQEEVGGGKYFYTYIARIQAQSILGP